MKGTFCRSLFKASIIYCIKNVRYEKSSRNRRKGKNQIF